MHHNVMSKSFLLHFITQDFVTAKMLPGQDSSFHTSRCSRCNIRSRTRSEWRCTPERKYLSKDEKYKRSAQTQVQRASKYKTFVQKQRATKCNPHTNTNTKKSPGSMVRNHNRSQSQNQPQWSGG